MRKLPHIILRRLLPLILIGVAALAVAVVTAMTFGQSTYHISAQLVYTPLPTAGVKDLYEPPELKTLLNMVKTPENLARLKDEFHLVEPVRLLDQLIEVDNPSLTDTITIALDWSDADEGTRMLDRLMAIYSENVADLRRAKLAGYVADMESAVQLTRRRRSGAAEALRKFNAELAITDFESGPKELTDQIASMEFSLEQLFADEARYKATVADSERRLEESKRVEAEKAAKEAEEDAAQESLTDQRNRQARLAELIARAEFEKEVQIQIAVAREAYNRALSLYERHMETRAEVEKLRGDLLRLQAKIEKTPKIVEWEGEMAEIDKTLVPAAGKKRPKQSPIITQLLVWDMQNKQDLLGTQSKIDHYKGELAMARRRLQKLQQVWDEGEALQLEVESLDRQLQLVEQQRNAFEQILNYKPHEFSVASPATHLLTPPSSNRKKLALMALLAIGLLLAGPMLAWDFYRARQADGAVLMSGFGLPTISPPLAGDRLLGRRQAMNARRWCDQVSLRIQQLAPQPGTVVLLTHHRPTSLDAMLWYGTAGALSERDERVCVVLAQPDETTHALFVEALTQPGRPDPSPAGRFTGLAEWLAEECDDVEELIVRTPRRNVDVVTGGMRPVSTNRMATRRMDELFAALRPRYSLVLVVGPEFEDTLGVEIAARQADGVIVCGEEDAAFDAAEEYTLSSLIELQAPLWGHVVRPNDDPVHSAEAVTPLLAAAADPRLETAASPGEVPSHDSQA